MGPALVEKSVEEAPAHVLEEALQEVQAYRVPATVLEEVLAETWLQHLPVHFRMVGEADFKEVVLPLAPFLLAIKLA